MTEKLPQLNERELQVLNAIKEAHGGNGGGFTYADEVLGELHGLIIIGDDKFRQINFCETVIKFIPDLEDYCEIY